jgi:site-specific DNA recombinase
VNSTNGNGKINLEGPGAAYIRVSTDQQDTERQYAAVRAFEQRHGVTIPKQHWLEDKDWARDADKKRPEFKRLLELAESGRVKWIVVDALDRFGTRTAKHLMGYLARLEDAGCKLYDASGKEWTGEDDATEITAWVNGKSSMKEQRDKSHRVIGGKAEKARAGEWQGGPVRLGFDVACYHRETDTELWRVVFQGRNEPGGDAKRLKVYPDGRTERFDGEGNFPKCQPMTEVLRIAPSNDRSKIDAAVSVFKRYATESVGFTVLAHYLNDLKFRNGCGGHFQHAQIEEMLNDPIYLGYYVWNRRHCGKFHRYANDRTVPDVNYDEKISKNDRADWVHSTRRLFEPIIDQATWDAVQRKLADREKRTNAPRSAAQYLAGLVCCGNCGGRMVTGSLRKTTKYARKDGHTGERYEYFCGTYFKAVREGRRAECKCMRNGVFQDTLEQYVERYLEETGKRLDKLTTGPTADCLTDKLQGELVLVNTAFWENWLHMLRCIAEEDPPSFAAMWEGVPEAHGVPLEKVITHYRSCFDPDKLTEKIEELEAKHTALYRRYADLPTPRAKDKAKVELTTLEDRIAELERRREDIGATATAQWAQVLDLANAVKEARRAMESDAGESALRQRAEAVRAVIQRIECSFTATGETGGGWGKKNACLATITIYPVVGDSLEFRADSKGTLKYSSAHSFM